jgi:hypothetical protein
MSATDAFEGTAVTRYVLIGAALLIALALATMARGADKKKERTRGDVQTAIAAAEQALDKAPGDAKAREQLARLVFESGDFWRAAELIKPAANKAEATPAEILLAAEIEYLLGHYSESERLSRQVLDHAAADSAARAMAMIRLGFVHYQTNRFDRFRDLNFPRGVQFPADKVIRGFEGPPYQVTWPADARQSEIPFSATDPLPALKVSYDGRPVDVLFDTGADMCIVDSQLAAELGIKEQGWTIGGFGGGKLGRMGYGKLRSVELGGVTLRDVPVWILPTRRFSSIYPGGKLSIDGIVGTALVRQFLATLDYQRAKLVLRERSPRARQRLRTELAGRVAAEVPFVLAGTHWMMASGSLDGREGLTFFVDSGLASDAAFSAPPQTLRYLGIAEPEQKLDPGSAGGGGGPWASGRFAIRSLGLGPLVQTDLVGEFGAVPAASYWQNRFIQDGLISHRFLSKYASWTIDFDAMTYVFAKPAEAGQGSP